MKNIKIPKRKCIGCGDNFPKRELVRIVNNSQEGVVIDPSGKLNGRGAYICKNPECFNKIKNNKKLDTALKTKVDEDIYKEIELYVDEN